MYMGELAGAGCSIIPSSQDCVVGADSVRTMDALYTSLDDATKAQFQQAHDSIMMAFNANYSSISSLIPFNPNCCAVEQIGESADALSSKMSGGAVTGPSASGAGGIQLPSLPNITTAAGEIGLGVFAVAAVALYFFLKKGG